MKNIKKNDYVYYTYDNQHYIGFIYSVKNVQTHKKFEVYPEWSNQKEWYTEIVTIPEENIIEKLSLISLEEQLKNKYPHILI